jgi:DNA adenine methylase
LQGKFLLSLNDVPQVRALFSDFMIRDIDLHYTAQKSAGRRYRELIITNY